MPLHVSCPGPVLRLACLGGGRPGPDAPLPGLGLCAPPGVGLRVRGVPVLGGGVGGGGAACAPCPPFVRPGGPVGRGVALPGSVPLPSLGRQQSRCHWRCSGHGGRGPHTTPVRARLPSLGAVRVASRRVGAGSLVLRGSCGSRRPGRGGGPCSGPPLGRRGPARGEGEPSPLPQGVGAGAPAACGPVGGGGRAAAPLLSLWGAACGSPLCRPLVAGAFPPPACAFGRGRGAAPCTWCSLPGGGGGWRPVNRPPGGSDRPNPSLCPPRVGNIAGVTSDALASGARPPYCSGSSSRAAPGHGPCVAPACWCGLARRPRPPQEQAGGGRRGARRAGPAAPPPGRRGPFWGRGDVPSAPGGQGGRRSCGSQAGGGAGGGGGGAALLHPHLGFYEVPESRM